MTNTEKNATNHVAFQWLLYTPVRWYYRLFGPKPELPPAPTEKIAYPFIVPDWYDFPDDDERGWNPKQ